MKQRRASPMTAGSEGMLHSISRGCVMRLATIVSRWRNAGIATICLNPATACTAHGPRSVGTTRGARLQDRLRSGDRKGIVLPTRQIDEPVPRASGLDLQQSRRHFFQPLHTNHLAHALQLRLRVYVFLWLPTGGQGNACASSELNR